MKSLQYLNDLLEIYRFESSRNNLFKYKTFKYKNKLNYFTPNNSPIIYKNIIQKSKSYNMIAHEYDTKKILIRYNSLIL